MNDLDQYLTVSNDGGPKICITDRSKIPDGYYTLTVFAHFQTNVVIDGVNHSVSSAQICFGAGIEVVSVFWSPSLTSNDSWQMFTLLPNADVPDGQYFYWAMDYQNGGGWSIWVDPFNFTGLSDVKKEYYVYYKWKTPGRFKRLQCMCDGFDVFISLHYNNGQNSVSLNGYHDENNQIIFEDYPYETSGYFYIQVYDSSSTPDSPGWGSYTYFSSLKFVYEIEE